MAPAVVLVAAIVVLVGVAMVVVIRAMVKDEERLETRLHDPQTHTVAYPIPHGVDPATVKAALATAGFDSVHDRVGDDDCLVVECGEDEREMVRSVIEGVHVSAYDGSELRLGSVMFTDER